MADNLMISNNHRIKQTIGIISQQGADSIHVISDFDKTLTKAFVNGEKTPSIPALIRHCGYLSEEFIRKDRQLHDYYHPIEINPLVSRKEKTKKMHEWWLKHYQLLAEYGLTKQILDEIVQKKILKFRDGSLEFIDFLHEHNIPLVIMSAADSYMISEHLRLEGRMYGNVHIIANQYEFDRKGKVLGIKEPIIHSLNKYETMVHEFPTAFKAVKNRKNVLLLGDMPDDVGMIEGFEYSNIIKVGFLNEHINENLENFKKNFDIVILNDGDMVSVNKLLKKIVKS